MEYINNICDITIPPWFILLLIVVIIVYYIYYKNQTKIVDINKKTILLPLLSDKKYKDKTILDWLKYVAKKYPKRIALKTKINKWNSITYKEYYESVVEFSESLNYWINPNVNVGIIGSNSSGWVYAHLGCMMNGGISVGINQESDPMIFEYILEDANIQVLVVEDNTQLKKIKNIDLKNVKTIIYYSPIKPKILKNFKIPVVSMGSFVTKRKKNITKPTLNNIATLIYNTQNGVVITHKNIMSTVSNTFNILNSNDSQFTIGNEQLISYLQLNNITTQLFDIYIPIMTLSTVWFAHKNSEYELSSLLQKVHPTIFIGTDKVWDSLATESKDTVIDYVAPWKKLKIIGFDKCKIFFTTEQLTNKTTINYLRNLNIQLSIMYGVPETTGIISILTPFMNKQLSMGFPIMEVKVNKNNEICVRGDNLALGYYNKNNLKKWFNTGIFGNLCDEGFLYNNT
jgi:long-subunit acyl-CoA synthetase (AMP-forming)